MNDISAANDRLTAFGNQLIAVHDWLRDTITHLRENVDSPAVDLRTHCLAFCHAITRHHTGEDSDAFTLLREQFPTLSPVLDTLSRDHGQIEHLLQRLQHLLDTGDRVAIGRELDGIAVLLESHFFYEEKKIITALNSLHVPEWERERPAFLERGDD
ncbi:hemerythrin domain-containing protein [Tenggerimyces flavus]|uniref:Hemerythrin domain-containing protein n=1 Tax=Tenggerimyces flavus TaxID=1708749 RepID=A0ABV7YC79_9ACTN|nr:hemerythrin domain-containing protein [Tenggerimyces flavus]MBM7785696.1 hemerythrin-like domain-containing protein [Tenggerimyces flavus]